MISQVALYANQLQAHNHWNDSPPRVRRPRVASKGRDRTTFNLDRKAATVDKYRKAMLGKEMTIQEIAKAMSMHEDAMHTAVKKLAKEGHAESVGQRGKAKIWRWKE